MSAAAPLPRGQKDPANSLSFVPDSTTAAEIAALATEVKQDAEILALAEILAKLISDPATEARQEAGNTSLATLAAKDLATQATLAAVLAKLPADPATQTTLAAILAKMISAPATEAKQDAANTSLAAILTKQPTAPALDGADISAPTAMPTGGVGIRGWLSAIWTKLNGLIGVTGTVTANTGLAQPVTDAQLRAAAVPVVANPPVVAATSGSLSTTAVGTVVTADLRAYAAAIVTITGTWTGTLVPQSSGGDSGFGSTINISFLNQGGVANTGQGSTTGNGQFVIPGGSYVRIQIAVPGTGTVNVSLQPMLVSPWLNTMGVAAAQTGTWLTVPVVNTGQGITAFYKLLSAATTNAAVLKVTPGGIASIVVSNTSASWRYVKFYNKTSAPTVGTDVPVQTIPVPPGQTHSVVVGGFAWRFINGVAIAVTANFADSDATAIGAGEIMVNVGYF